MKDLFENVSRDEILSFLEKKILLNDLNVNLISTRQKKPCNTIPDDANYIVKTVNYENVIVNVQCTLFPKLYA